MTCGVRSPKRLPAVLLGAALALLCESRSLAAQAQATTGLIRGVVSDPSGSPVAGARVTVTDVQTRFQHTVVTNEKGVFVAPLLPLGTYEVTARAVGLGERQQTDIILRVGETVDLALKLEPVELAAVTVTATPLVDVTKVETSTRLPNQAVSGLPNNGRNYLNLTLLTPNVSIVQGPDGDELTVAGQKGIHNNVSVDGADFNNPFFGEQRGGQRPPFTFNLDAVQEIVVTAAGANAEFGRSSGGFVNVVTKSGTNQLHGSVHYYGKDGALSAQPHHAGVTLAAPDFTQHQFGFTLGGPIKRDRAFFFVAYDQQIYDETKQTNPNRLDPALRAWMDSAYNGALSGDYGPIKRTNNARVLMGKLDFRLSDRHNASLKYNYTWSEQANGTFDVDSWARSANGLEADHSNAINGSLVSYLTSNLANEFRFQYSREDRPRPYDGPRTGALGPNRVDGSPLRPFPDIAMGPNYRLGMPFFLPVDYYDTRVQLLDNVSMARGDHFFKLGFEYNKVHSVQTFVGFGNSRYIFNSVPGFLSFAANVNYVECVDTLTNVTSNNTTGGCPINNVQTGPVLLYLQQAGVGRSLREAGTQDIPQTEYALYLQDTWKPSAKLTFNFGLRWEAQIQADPITPPSQVFYAPFIGQTVTNSTGTYTFPSDGTIPSDRKMFQPRFGFAYDPGGDGRRVVRGSAGLYYARIPGLNLASSRSTNGSIGMTYFRGVPFPRAYFGPVPAFGAQLPDNVSQSAVFFPDVFVFDKNFQNPRTLSANLAYEWQVGADLGASISYAHSRSDQLTRFINRNDGHFGSPWGSGLPAGNGIFTLTTVEASAKSRYNGITIGLKRVLDPNFQFQVNYTLSYDKSDDDNERDPFTFRYARADSLAPEYNWSDRDQRHRFNGWMVAHIGGGLFLNSRLSIYSAQPTSEKCGANNQPSGQRAVTPQDRICLTPAGNPTGVILKRNTLRKDNSYFSWDLGLTWPFNVGKGRVELVAQMFNVLGSENFRDPAQTQIGLHWVF